MTNEKAIDLKLKFLEKQLQDIKKPIIEAYEKAEWLENQWFDEINAIENEIDRLKSLKK